MGLLPGHRPRHRPAGDRRDVRDVARVLRAAAADKRRILRDADNPWGFFDKELTKNRQDWKEIYDYGPDVGDGACRAGRMGRCASASSRPCAHCYESCTALALRLLSVIASNLGVSPQVLAHGFDTGAHTSFLRLNFYPR